MKFIQQLINQKAQFITGDELMKYAKGLSISLKKAEADQIASLLRQRKPNLFNDRERAKLLHEISVITNEQTAKKLSQLFSLFNT